MSAKNPLGITELVLRDAHQSLLATRMRLADMLPIAAKLDQVGYWSMESWGGATFDSCIRYLGEDPWERLRALKSAMPNTPQQMLLRGQNILGYRHYADDVVEKFVERAAHSGIDVFRIFDAMNDTRNLRTTINAVLKQGKHAQGAISYTVSPVHTVDLWVHLAKEIQDMGAQSLCIKDMAGLLKPYVAFELVSKLKRALDIPVHLHCHATTGMSTATLLKAVEAGVDNADTAISSMSMTYGHSASETLVAILQKTARDSGLNIELMEEIAAYFREVRKKYAPFEGSLRGVDSRILVAQVPGGMLTNLESQLKQQHASDKIDAVLAEIPRVRRDLGYIPLVTPTSQIVGTQAVLNVLSGERYQSVTRETEGVFKGEYGATPAPLNKTLQRRILDGAQPITCRPADLLTPEIDRLTDELDNLSTAQGFSLCEQKIDDVLTYALFPQVAQRFFENRDNPQAFESTPRGQTAASKQQLENSAPADNSNAVRETYTVRVNGKSFLVEVNEGGSIAEIQSAAGPITLSAGSRDDGVEETSSRSGDTVTAGLAGNIVRVLVKPGDRVSQGQPLLVLEAMKMETEVSAPAAGRVLAVHVCQGAAIAVGEPLVTVLVG